MLHGKTIPWFTDLNQDHTQAITFSAGQSPLPGATPHVKCAWKEVFASTSVPFEGLTLRLPWGLGVDAASGLVDIGVGAASSEVVVMPDILVGAAFAYSVGAFSAFIPIAIPAGSRIAVRMQLSIAWPASEPPSFDVSLTGVSARRWRGKQSMPHLLTVGPDTATSTGLAWAGAYGLGAWQELVAVSTFPVRRILMSEHPTAGANALGGYEFGVGAAASEVVIGGVGAHSRLTTPEFHCDIPAGSRIAWRSASTGATRLAFYLFG